MTTFADARVELARLVRRIERIVAERDELRARGARPEYDAKDRRGRDQLDRMIPLSRARCKDVFSADTGNRRILLPFTAAAPFRSEAQRCARSSTN